MMEKRNEDKAGRNGNGVNLTDTLYNWGVFGVSPSHALKSRLETMKQVQRQKHKC